MCGRWLLCGLVVLSMGGVAAMAQPDGPIGTVQQPLVGGTVTAQQTLSDLRLLTLSNGSGTCSASMLNSSWAITAAHCVYPFGTSSSATPPVAAAQVTLTAAWIGSGKSVTGLQVVAFDMFPWGTADVALVQVPAGSFDNPLLSSAVIRNQRVHPNEELVAFGRGINALAFQAGAVAVPTQSDGLMRQAQFGISSVTPNSAIPPSFYSFAGRSGATVAGGDSGGPAYIQDWDDPLSVRRKLQFQLVGVHSSCSTTCLAGQSCAGASVWKWVSAVATCSDAAVFPLLARINAVIAAPGAAPSPGTFDTTVPASVLAHPRALYAVNVDEPLMPSAGAAQDIQLSFKQCHSFLQLGTSGCPMTPALQFWGYDVKTHRLLHVASGKCLNISGARRDPGAPIILFPCLGAANEKWTIISPPNASTWVLRSDLTKQCLNAVPGKAGGGHGLSTTLPTPALLTQMPCNGSTAQQFADADAAFAQQHGPH